MHGARRAGTADQMSDWAVESRLCEADGGQGDEPDRLRDKGADDSLCRFDAMVLSRRSGEGWSTEDSLPRPIVAGGVCMGEGK